MNAPWGNAVLVAATFCVSAALSPPSLATPPNVWDRAATPSLASAVAAYDTAQQYLIKPTPHTLGEALHVLEQAGAAKSPDPRPRVLLGRMLEMLSHYGDAEHRSERLNQCVPILEEVIRSAAEHPATIEARYALAIAYARLHEPRKEIAIYDQILQRETSPDQRTMVLSNQAEAFMVVGDLDRAIDGYRASLIAAHDNVLAHWGLAVALDRSGDLGSAIGEAQTALSYDPHASSLRQSNVFFVPDYDRLWYDAVGSMARARSASDPADAALWWHGAAWLWTQYMDAAVSGDRWTATARARRDLCERNRKAADKRAATPARAPAGSR